LGIHDPEGLISTIPAIGTGFVGDLCREFVEKQSVDNAKKALRLPHHRRHFFSGGPALEPGLSDQQNLWTSSFVLHVGGWSLILLALFYYIIDVRGYKRWAFFFSIIGMNSILIYMSDALSIGDTLPKAIFGMVGHLVGDPWNIVVMAICYVMVKWAFLYFLYRKNVFLRV